MQKTNIVFIGMMGCGKTTISKEIAAKLNMEVIDVDEYIESHWEPIPKLFHLGENHFRDIEKKAIERISKIKNIVISTGGGVVKKEENMLFLRENGIVFFIDRPINYILNDIETAHRPLIKEGKEKLISIYYDRYDLYKKYSDYIIKSNNILNDTIKKILKIYKSNIMK